MDMRSCEKCEGKETWKPARAHHCRECGHCVFKMDHHCPWINNCVGHRNMKFFLQFVIYICISSAYLSLMMVLSFYNLLTAKNTRYHMQSPVSPSQSSHLTWHLFSIVVPIRVRWKHFGIRWGIALRLLHIWFDEWADHVHWRQPKLRRWP